jgi:DNA-binding transcriptional ArsR family regulator
MQMNQAKLSANQELIVAALKKGHVTVAEIAEASALTKAAVSANMKPLRDKGIIETNDSTGVMIVSLASWNAAPAVATPAPTSPIHSAPAAVLIASIEAQMSPRTIVKNLITTAGMTKKAAKRVVYDRAYC